MPILSKETLFTLMCGIFSGGVFVFVAYNPDAGPLVIFLPLMPLAIAGLCVSARSCLIASLIVCLMAARIAGQEYAVSVAVIVVIPLLYFVRKALLWRGDEQQKQWYPLMPVVAELTLMACIAIAGVILLMGHSEQVELKSAVAQSLHRQLDSQFNVSDPDAAATKKLIDEWSFVLFAFAGWLWVMMIYGFSAIANTFLKVNGIALRPSLALGSRGLPLWLPFVILVAAGLAAFGNGNDRYLGEAVILLMIMPYFLSGIASFHEISHRFGNRWLWIAVFYITLLVFPALSVFVIAKGVHAQIEELIKNPPVAKDY